MNARLRWGTAASISVLFAITGIAACGGSDDDSPAAAASPGTTSPATSAPAPTADEAGWQDEVAATCDALIAALESVPAPEPTPEGLTTQIAAIQAAVADLPGFDEVTVPADVQDDWDHILTVVADAGASLEAAAAASAAGDPLAAEAALSMAGDARQPHVRADRVGRRAVWRGHAGTSGRRRVEHPNRGQRCPDRGRLRLDLGQRGAWRPRRPRRPGVG